MKKKVKKKKWKKPKENQQKNKRRNKRPKIMMAQIQMTMMKKTITLMNW